MGTNGGGGVSSEHVIAGQLRSFPLGRHTPEASVPVHVEHFLHV